MKSKRSYISIKSVLLFCIAENIDWLGWEIGGGEGREQSYLNFSVYVGVKFASSSCTIHEEMANF